VLAALASDDATGVVGVGGQSARSGRSARRILSCASQAGGGRRYLQKSITYCDVLYLNNKVSVTFPN